MAPVRTKSEKIRAASLAWHADPVRKARHRAACAAAEQARTPEQRAEMTVKAMGTRKRNHGY